MSPPLEQPTHKKKLILRDRKYLQLINTDRCFPLVEYCFLASSVATRKIGDTLKH